MNILKTIEHDRNFATVDIFKFIMAFAVIAIHTNPVVNCTNPIIENIVKIVEGWAVPFFFIASGFFMFYNKESNKDLQVQRLGIYLKKIIILYCVWTFFSFPLAIYGYMESDNTIRECVFSYIKYFLFVGKLYNSYHLWYLLALIYAVAIIYFMMKHKCKIEHILIVAVTLYFMNDLLQYLINNLQNTASIMYKVAYVYQYVFNKGGIFTGMLYVSMGMVIAHRRQYLNRWISILVIVALNFIKPHCGSSFVVYLKMVEATAIFMALISIEIRDGTEWHYLRKASTIIYLSHLIWYSLYTFTIIKKPNKLGLDSFVVTSVLSLANAIVLIELMKKPKMKWIKEIT